MPSLVEIANYGPCKSSSNDDHNFGILALYLLCNVCEQIWFFFYERWLKLVWRLWRSLQRGFPVGVIIFHHHITSNGCSTVTSCFRPFVLCQKIKRLNDVQFWFLVLQHRETSPDSNLHENEQRNTSIFIFHCNILSSFCLLRF